MFALLRHRLNQLDQARDDDQRHEAVEDLIQLIQQPPARSPEQMQIQSAAMDLGAIGKLCGFAMGSSTARLQSISLLCLSELAFSNVPIKRAVFEAPGMMDFLAATVTNASSENYPIGIDENEYDRDENAYWLVNALASQLWDCHEVFVQLFLTPAIRFLNTLQPHALAACSVRFINLLSYNDRTKVSLTPAIEALFRVVRTGDHSLNYFAAALAVANLGAGSNHSTLVIHGRSLFEEMRDAFDSTLESKDYPHHSGNYYTAWKLCMSFVSLSENPQNCAAFRSSGLLDSLCNALRAKGKVDDRLCENILKVLWNVNLEE